MVYCLPQPGGGQLRTGGEQAFDDQGSGQVGEIAEGFMFDLPTDAYGAAEQVGGIGTALVAAFIYGYVNGTGSGCNKQLSAIYIAKVKDNLI